MNKIEKFIYDKVKKNPKLKDSIRNIYQDILCLIPRENIVSNYKILERQGYFFGFHDKIPFSRDNTKVLAHKFSISNREINEKDEVSIGYFTGDNFENFIELEKTKSWNWQQGAMLQWVGDSNNIAFNYWNGNNNVCRIVNEEGKVIKDLTRAIGAIDYNGKYALSYSFERLNHSMYGYGYCNEADPYKDELMPKNTGIYLIDIESNTEKLLFSIEDIVKIENNQSMNNCYHFFTHTIFSPNGKRFLFLHRWYKPGNRLMSRLISSDLYGNDINIFNTDGMVSHFSWIGNDKVIAFCNTKENGDGYYIFNDLDSSEYEYISKELLNVDGHPQFNTNTELIITDTYPNRFRMQELIIYNYKERTKKVIAKLNSPKNYRSIVRCDLHPRWNRDGNLICFDSAHNGKRSLCIINIKN